VAQLELVNLQKAYQVGNTAVPAVENISLRIEKGELVSIVGHSGSGKTTLVSIIGGILRPTSGQVLFDGRDISRLNDDALSEFRARKIGFMFQFASLLPMLTVRENLLLPRLFHPDRLPDGDGHARRYLELVGMADKADAYPAQLSGGQQRRVAIARGLMNDPALILADEPTGDLDEETEAEIMALLRRINEEQQVTLILITHNGELARSAGRQLRMERGRAVALAG